MTSLSRSSDDSQRGRTQAAESSTFVAHKLASHGVCVRVRLEFPGCSPEGFGWLLAPRSWQTGADEGGAITAHDSQDRQNRLRQLL